MKKFTLVFLSLFFFQAILFAGNDPRGTGARSNALGDAGLTLIDPFALFNNQAALAFMSDISVGLYTERKFSLGELSYHAGGVAVPTNSGVFGLSVGYYGFDAYNEKRGGLTYSRLITGNVAAGIQVDYLSTSVTEYGSGTAFTAEAGLMVKISEKLAAAAHVFNPYPISTGFEAEKIPTILNIGMSYMPGEKVWLSGEAEKDIDEPARFKAGLEYRVVDALHLRTGFETNPGIYCFGIGINVKSLCIDLASQYHQVLGLTPQIALRYSFTKKSAE